MRHILIILLLISNTSLAANYYVFQKTTGTYSPLTNDTIVSPITNGNNGAEYMIPLGGSSFILFNNTYNINDTSIFVYFSTNGHLGIQTDTSFLIFDALFTWLDSVDNNSSVSYVVEGTGNNKIIKLQWKNLKLRAGPTGSYANAQIWLYQATGIVECRYGPSALNNQSGYNTVNGPNIGLFHSNKAFSAMHEKIWINGSPSNYTIDSAKNNAFNAMSGVPSEGTIYRFIPRHITSIKEVDKESVNFKVYPNPASAELHIVSNKTLSHAAEVLLLDMTGKIMLKTTLAAGRQQAFVSTLHLPNAMYQLVIQNQTVNQRQKVLITHK